MIGYDNGLLVGRALRLAALVLSLALHLLGVVAGDGAHQVLRRFRRVHHQTACVEHYPKSRQTHTQHLTCANDTSKERGC